jgi:glycosyltransferase involved in cell wall biosynthesis
MTDLIVFGKQWGGTPSATHHLMSHMPAPNRVLWVNSVALDWPHISLSGAGRAAMTMVTEMAGLAEPSLVYPRRKRTTPPGPVVRSRYIPMARNASARAINRALVRGRVGDAVRSYGIERPVLWISQPTALDAIGSLGESAVVYYRDDDFGLPASADPVRWLEMEAEAADRADLIVTSSAAFAERYPAGKTSVLPHAVDHDLFSRPARRAPDLPYGRIAGFIGTLSDALDYDLIAATARLLPDWRFVFVGEIAADVSAIAHLPNVLLLGPKLHHEAPGYAQHWTTGLIPYRAGPRVACCDPLKLREYLAAGRPVVATPFPAVQRFAHLLGIAPTPETFAEAIERTRFDNGAAARKAAVANDSWDARAAEAATLIAGLRP